MTNDYSSRPVATGTDSNIRNLFRVRTGECKRCGGDLSFEYDLDFGWHQSCIQCGANYYNKTGNKLRYLLPETVQIFD